jgi:hydrogenase large subunit
MDIYLPIINNENGTGSPPPTPSPTPTPKPSPTPTPGGKQRIVIDPLTRIEGHLRIEAVIEGGQVVDAWSSSTMFRGMEMILKGRDPREAWLLTQRACGVCTTVHAIASVRAVENALGITVPDNARLIRNLIEAAQYVQDHVIHFYHLHAVDWVDVPNALQADPAAAAALQQSLSDWPNNTAAYFSAVKARLQTLVDSGQLGIFANGYWGHPAMKLPPEANLMAVAHYLEALDWQREFIKIHAVLGGKNPHPQTYVVGGVTVALDPNSATAINPTKIAFMRDLIGKAADFVNKVYYPDLMAVASFYKDWAGWGAGVGSFLSYGDFPATADNNPANFWLPGGLVWNQQIGTAPAAFDPAHVTEYVTHSWYNYTGGDAAGRHPAQGETVPNYTGPTPPFDLLNTDGKYSWLKSPRFEDKAVEVGPLARMLVAYAAGHAGVRAAVGAALSQLGVPAAALFSTLGRTAARGIETVLVVGQMNAWLSELENNLNSGKLVTADTSKWNPASWPASAAGWGWTEAPRGALGHWVNIQNGKITNYQMVVPTTWNGSPRDASGQLGPFESALIGTPVADPARPLEILRTIHSFDPCMACAVHLIDTHDRTLTDIQVGF